MDNRIFNINGEGKEMLERALELVFEQSGSQTCKGWKFSIEHGLILCWWASQEIIPFPGNLTAKQCVEFAWSWLLGDQAKTVKLTGWDADADHDGHNSEGWRVYCEDWGNVADCSSGICAIKPVYLWHGK